ncbi:RNA-binding protein [Lactobacillus sp. Sy-1]|uniref:YlmH family RNA-binding protein n=1 Tax=Lactobacillus sp. Sy-1 TaxID=2109645 RepID=UPI001C5668A5|nr:YlmH/Sll1252 family protein [Lactobacillus sp. Sy-1]MBW1605418.1 RNA-binding protein [Lactobacillus sp. Sy-1]
MNENIEQHFRKDEIPFLESMDDLVSQSINEYRPFLTSFLNPRQVYLLQIIVNGFDDVNLSSFGGLHNSEMQRALIYPSYFEPTQDDFKLCLFEINYPTKFANLHHSQILGTLIGSGIERNVIGDILFDGIRWQFVTESEMETYLRDQIDRIGKIKVNLKQLPINKIIEPVNEWKTVNTTITSLRIDNVIAKGFNISRNVAKELVVHGKIHLNWGEFNRPDYELEINDVLSVRGYGRLKVSEVLGISRRNKLRVNLSILKK